MRRREAPSVGGFSSSNLFIPFTGASKPPAPSTTVDHRRHRVITLRSDFLEGFPSREPGAKRTPDAATMLLMSRHLGRTLLSFYPAWVRQRHHLILEPPRLLAIPASLTVEQMMYGTPDRTKSDFRGLRL